MIDRKPVIHKDLKQLTMSSVSYICAGETVRYHISTYLIRTCHGICLLSGSVSFHALRPEAAERDGKGRSKIMQAEKESGRNPFASGTAVSSQWFLFPGNVQKPAFSTNAPCHVTIILVLYK